MRGSRVRFTVVSCRSKRDFSLEPSLYARRDPIPRHPVKFRRARARRTAPRDAVGQNAQGRTAARNPRPDGPDRQGPQRGDFFVLHPLQAHEKDCRALLLGKLVDGALEITQFQPLSLIGLDWLLVSRAQLDPTSLARSAAKLIDMLVMQD